MRALFLVTYTTDCINKWRSLACLGHDTLVATYDDRPHEQHGHFVEMARQMQPDVIIMVGAVEADHHRPVLRSDTISALRQMAPTVLLCGDAADPPWWPTLEEYYKSGCFTVIATMDGQIECPVRDYDNGLILCTPTDVRAFNPRPWAARDIRVGMVGGSGSRAPYIEHLRQRGLMDFHEQVPSRSYDEFGDMLSRTKVTFCNGRTGSGAAMHVKGRIIEAGMAGSVVLDVDGSPTQQWFIPGVDYIRYASAEDAANQIEAMSDEALMAMAARFHAAVMTFHHPAVFWSTVFLKIAMIMRR